MAISFVASSTNGAGTGTSITCTAPTGTQQNDVIIAVVHNNGTRTVADNNGATPFTEVLGNRVYNGNSANVYIFSRVVGASDPSSYSFTLSTSDRWSIILSTYRGVDTTSIFDVTPSATTENTGTGSTNTTDALITGVDGAMIIAFACNDSSTVTFNATPADSFNSRENNSGEQLLALADKVLTTAGTQSAVSWTQSASNGTWLNNIFSLKPSSTSVTVSASVLVVTSSLPTPTITAIQNTTINSDILTATFSIPNATVKTDVTINPNTLVVNTTLLDPTVSTTQNPTILATAQELTFSIQDPTVTAIRNVVVQPSVQTLSFNVMDPTATGIQADVTVEVKTLVIGARRLIWIDYKKLALKIDDEHYISL